MVVQRNAHSSTIDALVLSGMRPTFVAPEIDPELGIAHCLTPEALDAALDGARRARSGRGSSRRPTSAPPPTSRRSPRSRTRTASPLIVDEAWGAHMAFHEALPEHALAAGADLVISSTHKIVGSLTQSAMLHLGHGAGELIGEDIVDRAVTLTESTSPNSLLFGSLDAARRQAAVHGRELLEHTMAALAAGARADPRDRRPRRARRAAGRARPGVYGYDPLRLAVDVRGIARQRLRARGAAARDRRHQPRALRPERDRGRVRDGRARLPEAARLVEALREAAARVGLDPEGEQRVVRRGAAVGRAGDDPARGLPRRAGGRARRRRPSGGSPPSRSRPTRRGSPTCCPASA